MYGADLTWGMKDFRQHLETDFLFVQRWMLWPVCVCERETHLLSHSCAVIHLQMFGSFRCVVFAAVLVFWCFLATLVFLVIASSVRTKRGPVHRSSQLWSFSGESDLCASLCFYFFLNSFLKELLKPPLSCFLLLSAKGVWWFSSVPALHFGSSPHDWNPESWCEGT